MGRTDREEVMENVYKDLDEAAHYLPETYGTQREFATKGAAYAIKARYALYNEDWELAAQAAKNVWIYRYMNFIRTSRSCL